MTGSVVIRVDFFHLRTRFPADALKERWLRCESLCEGTRDALERTGEDGGRREETLLEELQHELCRDALGGSLRLMLAGLGIAAQNRMDTALV